ncbi:MAG: hypothetical protein UY71_C0039G0002 [Parcubacteria group bacterium GW2011_GWB1_52_7]|nr:MAG: hypothetical protein UY71_C0039G0002 [Parcubacteria group bacterium GW2011_GWB1_52_7]
MYIATFKTQTGPHRDFEFIDVATDEEAIREAQESAYKRGETVGSVYLLGRMVYSR